MSWKIIAVVNGLGVYRADWDRLNAEIYDSQPFFDSRFIELLLKYFATGTERLCVHSQRNIIAGLLILTPRRLGVWTLFVPAQAQIAPVLLKDKSLLPLLLTSLPNFSLSIEFLNQDPLLTPIQANSDQIAIIREPHALTIAVDITSSFEQYWLSRSRKLQQNYGRYLRRTQKNFPYVLNVTKNLIRYMRQ